MLKSGILCMALVFLACKPEKKFSSIRTGMKAEDVIQLVGRPESKRPMVDAEWWVFNDPGKHVVILKADTVVKCTTQQEAMETMEKNLRMLDSLKNR